MRADLSAADRPVMRGRGASGGGTTITPPLGIGPRGRESFADDSARRYELHQRRLPLRSTSIASTSSKTPDFFTRKNFWAAASFRRRRVHAMLRELLFEAVVALAVADE